MNFTAEQIKRFRMELERAKNLNKFTCDDLQNGDIIVMRDGSRGVIIKDKNIVVCQNGRWHRITDYNQDLTLNRYNNLDILQVFRSDIPFFNMIAGEDHIVYDRNRNMAKEMTVSEIEEILGCAIKIVKE